MSETYPVGVELAAAQAELRSDLGLRPETRLDCIIFRVGSSYEMRPSGVLEQVRDGQR